jgi:hypothetical protein
MLNRTLLSLAYVFAALTLAAPAVASVDGDAQLGRAVIQRLQARTASCETLTGTDFEHVGEYVTGRMAGSLRLHEAMNARMRAVLGADNEQRMHELMGRRYAGCASPSGQTIGPAMMGARGWSAKSMWGPMMATGDWDWMRDGNWQHLSQADWQRVSDQWMGPGMMHGNGTGWSTAGVLAAVVGAFALLGGLLAVRRRTRRHRAV